MPFYIVHVSGPSASKRVLADAGTFETERAAEDAARRHWPHGDYFIVEADDEEQAGTRAIGESRGLD